MFIYIDSYILTMAEATSIQVSRDLLTELKERKMYSKESYEEIIWDLLEDSLELSRQTKENILESERNFKEGRTHTLEEVEKRLGL